MSNLDIRIVLSRIENANMEFDKLIEYIDKIKKNIPIGEKLSLESPEEYRKIIKKITDLKTIINEYIKGEGTLVELVKEKMKNAEKLKTLRWIKNTLTPDLKTKRNYLIQLENSL